MHFAGEQHYYETRQKEEHAHIVCLRCGKVEEFFGEALRSMKRQVETNLGFRIATARTEMGGYCPDCQAQCAPGSAATDSTVPSESGATVRTTGQG
jgi:Fur family ferric uptake transcriptional regulator